MYQKAACFLKRRREGKNATVKAIRFDTVGGPEVLSFVETELSSPGPGEVRVKHTAIGVNFIDTYHRSGLYKLPLPSGIGLEAAGTVEALGEGVDGFALGDRVGYCSGPIGAYAEANNVPADRLVRLPDGIDDVTAAASMMKGCTAQYLLKQTFSVKAGQTILFHAAAGGVGLIACQWAKALGARVIGTVGSAEKIDIASEAGCEAVFNARTEDWVTGVRDLTDGAGVPVVYDSVGKDTFEGSLDCLSPRGLMVTYGNASGPVPPVAPSLLTNKGSLFLTRPSISHYSRSAEELRAMAGDFFAAVASGAVKITVGQQFALADAKFAHIALHSRQTVGSTVLIP
jgi:NADPH:quinone reductase